MIDIKLSKNDTLNLIGLLINFDALSSEWFNNCEPTASTSQNLAKDILKQAIEDGAVITDEELTEKVHEFVVSGVKL